MVTGTQEKKWQSHFSFTATIEKEGLSSTSKVNNLLKSLDNQKKWEVGFIAMLCIILSVKTLCSMMHGQRRVGNLPEYQEILTSRYLLQGGRIDLNTASRHALMALPGIGPSRAKKILEMRKRTGGFENLAQLAEIRGISQRLLDQLQPFVVVRNPNGDKK